MRKVLSIILLRTIPKSSDKLHRYKGCYTPTYIEGQKYEGSFYDVNTVFCLYLNV